MLREIDRFCAFMDGEYDITDEFVKDDDCMLESLIDFGSDNLDLIDEFRRQYRISQELIRKINPITN